ncbi:MAG: hypothetical protein ACYCW6_22940 [Candidatus Xenobia bacterium]
MNYSNRDRDPLFQPPQIIAFTTGFLVTHVVWRAQVEAPHNVVQKHAINPVARLSVDGLQPACRHRLRRKRSYGNSRRQKDMGFEKPLEGAATMG